jgi:hypothetical protein
VVALIAKRYMSARLTSDRYAVNEGVMSVMLQTRAALFHFDK